MLAINDLRDASLKRKLMTWTGMGGQNLSEPDQGQDRNWKSLMEQLKVQLLLEKG